jgi:hypothetical protein
MPKVDDTLSIGEFRRTKSSSIASRIKGFSHRGTGFGEITMKFFAKKHSAFSEGSNDRREWA